jgi:hypothetical protein
MDVLRHPPSKRHAREKYKTAYAPPLLGRDFIPRGFKRSSFDPKTRKQRPQELALSCDASEPSPGSFLALHAAARVRPQLRGCRRTMSLSRCVARQPRPVCSGLGAATANGASARQKNRRCSDESASPRAIKDRRVTSPIRLTCGITGPELCPLRAGSRPAQFLRATERFLEERNLAPAGPLQTR